MESRSELQVQDPDIGHALCRELPVTVADDGSAKVPDRIQLLPPGEHIRGRDGREFTVDDIAAVVSRHTAPIPVDIEHGSEMMLGGDGRAIGWVEPGGIEASEAEGVWATVAWNQSGRELLSDRAYRWTSPAFAVRLTVGADGSETVSVHQFTSVAVTNRPNLDMSALNAKGAPQPESEPTGEIHMKEVAKAFGLEAEASEAEVFAALNSERETHKAELAELHSKVEAAPSLEQFVPRADFDAKVVELNAMRDEQAKREAEARDAEIDRIVGDAVEAGKITPASRDYHTAQCKTDGGVERFKAYVADAPSVKPEQTPKAPEGDGKVSAHSLGLTDEQAKLLSGSKVSLESFAAAQKRLKGEK